MNMKIIPILAAAAVAVLAAGCHHRHNNNDYYRPGPSHHYNHNDYNNGWHHGQNRPGPKPRPHYVTANQASYPRLYQLMYFLRFRRNAAACGKGQRKPWSGVGGKGV